MNSGIGIENERRAPACGHVNDGFVLYSEFGAKGDGVTDDFAAIRAAHDYANAHGLPVRGDPGAVYYCGHRAESAEIRTDVDWTDASFVLDDTKMEQEDRRTHTFRVCRSAAPVDLLRSGVTKVACGQERLDVSLGTDALVCITQESRKLFIREGPNRNSGRVQTDCFLLHADGRIDPSTPVIWDFDDPSEITAYPIEKERLTVRGGTFTTIANQQPSRYTYYTTGIEITRPNVEICGLTHFVTGELDHGAPYDAILQVNDCADVLVRGCLFTAHRTYSTIGAAGTPVPMGSYDLRCHRAANVTFRDCRQTTDILDRRYWGLFCSDFCKNLTLENCVFSRFDAHMGVTNAAIRGCTLGYQCLNAIGHGLLTVENSTLYGKSMISLRADYGSTWHGDVVIRDCTWIPGFGETLESNGYSVIGGKYSGEHDFGYPCYMPTHVTVERLKVRDGKRSDGYTGINLLGDFSPGDFSPKNVDESYAAEIEKYPYHPTEEITVRGIETESGLGYRLSTNPYMFRSTKVLT